MLAVVRVLLFLQTSQATVTGEVRQAETGDVLAGVTVSLPGLGRTTATDQLGRYEFRGVPAGVQPLAVRLLGHEPREVRVLVPRRGDVEINLLLVPQPVLLSPIQVRTRGDHVEFPDRGATMDRVLNNPLLAESDVFAAVVGGEVATAPESPTGIHIRGSPSDHTGYELDGVPLINPYHAGGTFGALNPDAIAAVRLSSFPGDNAAAALSGTVSAVTRTPGSDHRAQGSFSATQFRAAADGPLPLGVGYLFSLRTAFPGFFVRDREASYLQADMGDWLGKLEAPVAGGRLTLLAFESEDELNASAAVTQPSASVPQSSLRNGFSWRGRSLGVQWSGPVGGADLRVTAWNAIGRAAASWVGNGDAAYHISSSRADVGMEATAHYRMGAATTRLGVRFEDRTTNYVSTNNGGQPTLDMVARQPALSMSGQSEVGLGQETMLDVGGTLSLVAGDVFVNPRVRVRWYPTDRLSFSTSFAQTNQWVQSLRNPESVVGYVFPADLHVSADNDAVPVARGDQLLVTVDYRPSSPTHVGVQVYRRVLHDVLLPAVNSGGPFATNPVSVGSSFVTGGSIDASLVAKRYVAMMAYAFQHVQAKTDDISYTPSYAAPHRIDGGMTMLPGETFSVRVGMSGMIGRRVTPMTGRFEFESCNLGDRGCEFAGSPVMDPTRLGAVTLPPYVRLDLGVRKTWSIPVGARSMDLALFGTITNILGRANVLTYVHDFSVNESGVVEMRPRTPLVVGIDWSF